ncbi:MAG: tyrosine-type recombinase/integrase [Candidatus Bathyarchaeota archaeon]|nr:tyrosine-type recombinase/integrase [Candidatus Bathyarchaeota archaeon]
MPIPINLNLKKKKSLYSQGEEIPVNVYYYFDKKKLNVSTGVKTTIKDWNDNWKSTQSKNPIKKSDSYQKTKNLLIKNKVKEVEDIIHQIQLNNEIPTVDLVRSFLNQKERERVKESLNNLHFLFVLQEFRDWTNSIENRNREAYKKSIRTCLKRIENFTFEYQKRVGYKLLITDIDNKFQYSLIEYLNKLEEQPSTIRKRLKILVNLINWSREDRKYTDHRIQVVKMRWDFRREVIFLNRSEILKLIEFTKFNRENDYHNQLTKEYINDVLKNGKIVEYTNLEVIRDMLLFGCGIGCRFSDLVKIKVGNIVSNEEEGRRYLKYRMTKSQMSKEIKVPINKMTWEVFKKYSLQKEPTDYLFPRTKKGNPISNQKFNKHLKIIGELVRLERKVNFPKFNLEGQVIEGTDDPQPLYKYISSHIMRRTFIREGLNSGVQPRILMELSGHTTEKVFKRYFDTLTEEIDEEGKKMFDINVLEIDNSMLEKMKSLLSDNNNVIKKSTSDSESKLRELKSHFEKGLIPKEIYIEMINKLI